MSWRKFCILYGNLSAESLTRRNYDRIAKKEADGGLAEMNAWSALVGLGKPNG